MAFTSQLFLFYFLPLLLLVTYAVPRRYLRARDGILLVANGLFYAWLDPRFLGLLLISAVFNFALSHFMSRSEQHSRRRHWLWAALIFNLGFLGFFKYALFVAKGLNGLLSSLGDNSLALPDIILPVGISFYTFKAVAHVVDSFRTGQAPGSFLNFLCYLSFFPQVLSGPIQRYHSIDPAAETAPPFANQLSQRDLTLESFASGAALFILGFAKKILLADVLASAADAVFATPHPGFLAAWCGALAYSFQLYFDFSAYSEMAIGLGLMLGFRCGRNFNAPYRATSITEFWRRWHISLSGWFRDYLYIPLGGNRCSQTRSYLNLVIVFLLCGLWHGAAWTFVVWGIYHGLLLTLERGLGRRTLYTGLPKPLQVLATFLLISIGWVFFRSPTLGDAVHRLGIMFTGASAQGGGILLAGQLFARGPLLILALCACLAFQSRQGHDWIKELSWPKVSVLVILFILSLATLFARSFTTFLYFQF